MDKIFVDTNIVLDLLQQRSGFYEDAQDLFTLADQNKVTLFVSALTIANAHYVLAKHLKIHARKVISQFKVFVKVLELNNKILDLSLSSEFSDFEDAIQYYTAVENEMEIIITRNKKDFKNSNLPVLTIKEFLNRG